MAKKKIAVKKKAAVRKPAAKKKTVAKKAVTAKKVKALKQLPAPKPAKTKHKVFIEAAAFLPANSSDGYVDHFQAGRRTVIANRALLTAIPLPVGAVIKAMTIHYTNSTTETPLAFFLRKHADRHSPSGEIEMSFISMPPGSLPPDDYLSVTDTSFPDGGIIKDKFLHYLEISGTGDFGAEGRRTIRGVSIDYLY